MSTQPLVLVADDEPRITKLVSIALGEEGFRVVTASGGEEALAQGRGGPAGRRPARHRHARPRRHRGHAPAARAPAGAGHPADRQGLDRRQGQGPRPGRRRLHRQAVPSRRAGGPRPRRPPPRRRAPRRAPASSRFDDVEIDLERRMVTRDGELVQLSRTEWLLLQHLAANAGKVVLHTELLTKVWGPEYRDDLQYLRVWVSRVRRKLGAAAGRAGPHQDVPGHRLPARRRGRCVTPRLATRMTTPSSPRPKRSPVGAPRGGRDLGAGAGA